MGFDDSVSSAVKIDLKPMLFMVGDRMLNSPLINLLLMFVERICHLRDESTGRI